MTAQPAPDQPLPNESPAAAILTQRFYGELRQIAGRVFASERSDHTLQPTAVVNEACLRLMSGGLPDLPREQQLAIAGRVLKQVLIDHARARDAQKRGGGSLRIDIERDVLESGDTIIEFEPINRALEKLRQLSPRQAEVVSLRMFSGLSMEQMATVLGLSKRAVEGDWTVARAWLRRELAPALGSAPRETFP